MTTRTILTGLAATALLALTLAGCTATADDTTSADDTSASDSSTDTGDTGGGELGRLAGTGDYTVGVTAPIGGYSLDGDPGEQPEGCTWALEDADGKTQFQDQGSTVFITDVSTFFQTSGCPDWVQFE